MSTRATYEFIDKYCIHYGCSVEEAKNIFYADVNELIKYTSRLESMK